MFDHSAAFAFEPMEEYLLRLVQAQYPQSALWGTEPISKMAAASSHAMR